MKLRDWQKKASERRDKLTIKFDDYNAHKLLDSEIDLLIQIIEKQWATLELIANGDERFDKVSFKKRARTTQAEVSELVNKLMGER
jgi:hypothetical protein